MSETNEELWREQLATMNEQLKTTQRACAELELQGHHYREELATLAQRQKDHYRQVHLSTVVNGLLAGMVAAERMALQDLHPSLYGRGYNEHGPRDARAALITLARQLTDELMAKEFP